jgi:hypothetical protein
MKIVNIEKCEIDIIECDCGYHLGVDLTYLDQVGDFKTKCPSCNTVIDTKKIYDTKG